MGDRACYLAVCPNCDLRVSVADETCPECGVALDIDGQRRSTAETRENERT